MTIAYGYAHRQRRARLMRDLHDGDPCCRCGQPMYRDQALDADHLFTPIVFGGELPDALAHASCNRSAGASLGNRLRAGQTAAWVFGEDP